MKKKIIPCEVRREQFRGAGVIVGAAGSGNSAALQIRFSEEWGGLVKYATFRDALGESPVVAMLTTDMIEMIPSDEPDGLPQAVYNVTIPFRAKTEAGKMSVTIQGYELDRDGSQVEAAAVTAIAYFRVLPSGYAIPEDGSITPTMSQQLQAEIEAIKEDILAAAEAADAKEMAEAVLGLVRLEATAAQVARGGAETAADRAERAAELAATVTGGPFAPLDGAGKVPDEYIGDGIPRLRVIAARERDPAMPDYGLGGGWPEIPAERQAVLELRSYTGTADNTAILSGVEYDALNIGTNGEAIPEGTIIIRKEE